MRPDANDMRVIDDSETSAFGERAEHAHDDGRPLHAGACKQHYDQSVREPTRPPELWQ